VRNKNKSCLKNTTVKHHILLRRAFTERQNAIYNAAPFFGGSFMAILQKRIFIIPTVWPKVA
jgi:hypothetical protein